MKETTVYIDSSVVLAKLFEQPIQSLQWGNWTNAYTSTLTRVECLRAIDRFRVNKLMDDLTASEKVLELNHLFNYLGFIPLNDEVLMRASEPFPTFVATLDAIHLASAFLWRQMGNQEINFLTYDRQLGIAARVLAFNVLGVKF